ncbi:hypothetical protein KB206_10815 [Microvirga sp. STS02]|uniref:hypothetical protein n=1 Tax=Hymenobacter negativus TaxID=2795026 RepID=UPI0018DB321B|nr:MULTISPECIES: hypothetical protein [Bacteria]MBH8569378.1 hypothetical protein [Hymenobacter negativus]MBR7209112.1 hypothetical protein [Microvirga sp. STS02]
MSTTHSILPAAAYQRRLLELKQAIAQSSYNYQARRDYATVQANYLAAYPHGAPVAELPALPAPRPQGRPRKAKLAPKPTQRERPISVRSRPVASVPLPPPRTDYSRAYAALLP